MKKQDAKQGLRAAGGVSAFSKIRVTPLNNDKLRGLATVTVGEAMVVTGIRIVEGKHGLFIAMPGKEVKPQEFRDVVFPANKEVREELTALVLAAYEDAMRQAGQKP